MSAWERRRVFVTVRTYPVPARKGIEVSCTAGVTEDGRWIRLFPVPYRFLDEDRRFRKYQWIEASVRKAVGDARPESHNIDIDSIEIVEWVPPQPGWTRRHALVGGLVAHCLCCLKRERDRSGYPTLGLFRPLSIRRVVIREEEFPDWTEGELQRLRQIPMFGSSPRTQLEKIPYKFFFEFECPDEACNGHELSCTDWEVGELYRNCRADHGAGWEAPFRARIEDLVGSGALHFYVGTVHRHPDTWIIVGLYYPPKATIDTPQLVLLP